jgi:cytochrome c-type biogenesis protein CcmH
LAMAQGRKLAGEPARVIQRALDADPKHVKALALAGTVAFETQDYAAARGYWQRLLAEVPAESPLARSVGNSLAEAAALEGGGTLVAANDAKPAAAAGVGGDVSVSPELAARIGADDTLFIFARAAEGPRMPLAIVKRQAQLPATFTLDDTMAMSPQMKLSGYGAVVVGARISKSGNATPQAGDLIGQSAVVKPDAQGLRIVIDRVQP